MSLIVKALTPSGCLFSKETSEIYFPTVNGPIGIYADYAPGYFLLQDSGVIRFKNKDKNEYYAVFGGVVKVENNTITVITDLIEDGYSIDMARAIASRDRANDRINSKDPNIDLKRAQFSLRRALTRINVRTLTDGGK